MKSTRERKTVSLYACRNLLPIVSTGKVVTFVAAIFFQQESTLVLFMTCVCLTLLLLTTDTYLKLALWKCPRCKKQLPHDFYSRKTMTSCPFCGSKLDFSDTRFLVPVADTAEN